MEFAYTAIEVPKYKEQCCSLWFEDKVIKSAVDCLKDEIKVGLITKHGGHIAYGKGMDDGLKKCLRLIDSAFPDLNTKSSDNKKEVDNNG